MRFPVLENLGLTWLQRRKFIREGQDPYPVPQVALFSDFLLEMRGIAQQMPVTLCTSRSIQAVPKTLLLTQIAVACLDYSEASFSQVVKAHPRCLSHSLL